MQTMLLRALLATFLLCLAACKKDKEGKAPVLTQVFAGPVTLNLRQEITPGSKQAATAKHGDKLDVIQVRRRFVKLRTAEGKEGWSDARNLLTTEQMEDLRELAQDSAGLPSQGEATVYSTLNMHAEPNRVSTSFFQITEGLRVEVVDHELVQKPTGSAAPVTLRIEKPVRVVRRKPKRVPNQAIPPRGKAPGLPANWLNLSKTELSEEEKRAEEEEKRNAPKPPMEHWTLVRTKDKSKAGWVLSRNLLMTIPDDVAQYAEGARITSYFSLGESQDGEMTRNHWLWTTIRDGEQPHEFDSFRIFIWNLRRHRYETAYIERNVQGFYPTEVKRGKPVSFSLILREPDGLLYLKTFAFEGYLVRKIAETPYVAPVEQPASQPGQGSKPADPLSISDRLKKLSGKVLN